MSETSLSLGEYAQSLIAKGYPEVYAKGFAEGYLQEMVESVLIVLAAREIMLSDSDRERITTCRDIARLKLWMKRIVLGCTAEELFA
ncbi:hypothetical protein AB0L53_53565 [Nonomuraea sp. NPDC052129]|uniref:hypothetical protein n=1 Tax=Nonomuraea sp. NPDC052129 TaxID=3154651 RepID=UPI003420AF73